MSYQGMIVTEGITDKIVISKFLSQQQYCNKLDTNNFNDTPYKSNPELKDCEWFTSTINQKTVGLIEANGVSNIWKNIVPKLLKYLSNEPKNIKLILVTDNDSTNEVEQFCRNIQKCFTKIGNFEITAKNKICPNNWITINFTDKYSYEENKDINQNPLFYSLSLFILLIPTTEKGCLDTFIFDYLTEKNADTSLKKPDYITKELKQEIIHFVDSPCCEPYLKNRGEKLKAQLSTAFSILEPQKPTKKSKIFLKELDCSGVTELNTNFKEFQKLFEE